MTGSLNPYESPTSIPGKAAVPGYRVALQVLSFTVRFVGLSLLVGVAIGIVLCYLFSGGNATSHFYVTYALFGFAVGLLGGVPAAISVAILRALNRRTWRSRSDPSGSSATES